MSALFPKRQPDEMGHARLRHGRHSACGQIYLVTFTTHDRRRHFEEVAVAREAARTMTAPRQWQRSRLLAWVLMPDHWHGLIELGAFDSLPICVGRLKGRSSRIVGHAHPALGPLWSTAFHDRALRAEECLVGAARYIVMNPVRAGLVQHVGDYPYWDAVWL